MITIFNTIQQTSQKLKKRRFRVVPRIVPRGSAHQGFTLVELLVAVSIFTIVIAASTGAFISVLQAQRKAFAMQSVMDGSRFALESMAKAIRMSRIVTSSDGSSLKICHPTKGVAYDADCPEVNGLRPVIYQLVGTQIQENAVALTSSKINIENLWFEIEGVGTGDGRQPIVTIVLKASDLNNRANINLQTTISQRELDI